MHLINSHIINKYTFLLSFFLIFAVAINSNPNLQQESDILTMYKSSFQSGETYLKTGDYQNAIYEFKKSIDLADKCEFQEGTILCSMNLGLLYWNTGELEESSLFYKKALSVAEKNNNENYAERCKKSLDIYTLYIKGKEHRASGDYQESIECFQKAVGLARQIGSEAHELKCLRQMSICYLETSELDEFLALNKKALEKAKRLNHFKEEGRCLNNIGIYHWKFNEHTEAIASYTDALVIARKTRNKVVESACLNNIGLLCQSIGDYNDAIEFFMKAMKIDQEIDNKKAISIDLNNLGGAYLRQAIILGRNQDFQKAEEFFHKCLDLANDIKNKDIEVRVLNNIGIIYLNLNKYSESYNYFSIALEKAKNVKDFEAIGMINCNIAIYYQRMADLKKSIIFFRKSEEISKRIKAAHILWEVYFGLGKCYETLNRNKEAIVFYQKSIREIDSIRSQILLDTFKAGFMKDKLKVYECLINLLYNKQIESSVNNVGREIFEVVEKAKARAFLEVLGDAEISAKKSLDDALKENKKDSRLEISSNSEALSNTKVEKIERQSLKRTYQQDENEYMFLVSKMRTEFQDTSNRVELNPYSLFEIQKHLLDKNMVLIEYYICEQRSYLFVIEKNNFHLFLLPSRYQIEASIKGYLKEISDPPHGEYRGYLAAKRLYREFFSPVAKILPKSVNHLIIVPDGFLYYLPFESLIIEPEKESPNAQYLIEKYKISYAPSASSLLFLKEKRKSKEFPMILFAMGSPNYNLGLELNIENKFPSKILKELYENQGFEFSPLPHSKKEIKEISKYFPKNKQTVFLGDQAKEEVIKKSSLENYQIIHFACHSLLDERFPFRSALVLAMDKDSKEDGFLLVREMYNLRLSAEMIVLSACQTGRGRLENTEGVLGLPRIFFYCGARSVISSLWKINDKSTTKFMSYFYKYLSQGESKSQALRMAKLKMLKSRYSHPFYWASFILYGDEIPLHPRLTVDSPKNAI
jgi:CHAT domain-containing protein/Tfp pilus assembly protein PilF